MAETATAAGPCFLAAPVPHFAIAAALLYQFAARAADAAHWALQMWQPRSAIAVVAGSPAAVEGAAVLVSWAVQGSAKSVWLVRKHVD